MSISVTPIYAALLTLLYLVLSSRVIAVRRSQRISLGDNDDPDLLTRIRAQGNCAEYAPFGVLLLLLLELQGHMPLLLHVAGLILLSGRILHAGSFIASPMNFRWRFLGMALTLTYFGLSALILLVTAIL